MIPGHILHRIYSIGKLSCFTLGPVGFLIFFGHCPANAGQGCQEEVLNYIVKNRETKQIESRVTMRVTSRKEESHWFEKRQYGVNDSETFNVVFDPRTFFPKSYTRKINQKGAVTTVELSIADNWIKADVTKSGGIKDRKSIRRPQGAFVVEPFLKYYLTQTAAQTSGSGKVYLIAYFRGELRSFPIEWKSEGCETIRVAAGSFECIKLTLKATMWYTRLINRSSVVWLDRYGTHKLVRAPVKRKIFEKEKIMELLEYKRSNCGSS
jgi:hypothetical protein